MSAEASASRITSLCLSAVTKGWSTVWSSSEIFWTMLTVVPASSAASITALTRLPMAPWVNAAMPTLRPSATSSRIARSGGVGSAGARGTLHRQVRAVESSGQSERRRSLACPRVRRASTPPSATPAIPLADVGPAAAGPPRAAPAPSTPAARSASATRCRESGSTPGPIGWLGISAVGCEPDRPFPRLRSMVPGRVSSVCTVPAVTVPDSPANCFALVSAGSRTVSPSWSLKSWPWLNR